MSKDGIDYKGSGVDYDAMDPFKKSAQVMARGTSINLHRFGMQEVEESRGESAFVWEEQDAYRAFVIEGLGTKNLIADEMKKITGKSYYDQIAQDTVAMIVNDLIVVGAQAQVVNAYFAVGSSDWFLDKEKVENLVNGWTNACNMAGAVWGGGETPTLKGIIDPNTIDLSGAAVGIISPKERLTLGEKLKEGDAIVLIESSGIHANGLTLARKIAENLPQGYATQLFDGTTYGEALLTPTHIYAKLVRACFESNIDIHYMVNITGHGWRKLMRANKAFRYVIKSIPEPQPIFTFLQNHSKNDDEEMYGNFNMGAGFAMMIPINQVKDVISLSEKQGFKAWNAGIVEKGSKQVVIESKKIVYLDESLQIR